MQLDFGSNWSLLPNDEKPWKLCSYSSVKQLGCIVANASQNLSVFLSVRVCDCVCMWQRESVSKNLIKNRSWHRQMSNHKQQIKDALANRHKGFSRCTV